MPDYWSCPPKTKTPKPLGTPKSFLNIGLSLLTIALGFVLVLGDILLVTSVIQLGVELYDGIKAWEQGDRAAALEHLFGYCAKTLPWSRAAPGRHQARTCGGCSGGSALGNRSLAPAAA